MSYVSMELVGPLNIYLLIKSMWMHALNSTLFEFGFTDDDDQSILVVWFFISANYILFQATN